ncbi:MAG: adenosine-specific kinase [Candidatus Brockarchaeota archaeon]|nr:adenosine-specific kinase [Candidatus Brockarchaeota archaeon]
MDVSPVKIRVPEGCNLILGQAHFIKTVEDIYEAVVSSVPGIKFGVAFCESSGPCLVRVEGNDEELSSMAASMALEIGAGHCFLMLLKQAYPINVLNALKNVPEVCTIFCATANPVEVLVAETGLGRAVIGVVDGSKPKGIEDEEQRKERRHFLRRIGYKK